MNKEDKDSSKIKLNGNISLGNLLTILGGLAVAAAILYDVKAVTQINTTVNFEQNKRIERLENRMDADIREIRRALSEIERNVSRTNRNTE